jgi:hypothetical protein
MTDRRRAIAEAYLAERTGRLEYRFLRYGAVADEMFALGLSDKSLVMDVGAGMCDFDFYLRTVRGWKGRYLPVDASIDGVDIEASDWFPPRADFITAIEVLEHVNDPYALADKLRASADYGVVVTTPNTGVLGFRAVQEMDRTHVSPLHAEHLSEMGFTVTVASFFGALDDSLLGVYRV